ncbi:hypothetical protein P5673_001672, partial [Acropora cervicornis]
MMVFSSELVVNDGICKSAEDDVATVKDSSSPPTYTSTGGVAFQRPSELSPAYSEHSSYPVHASGQAIPGCHAPPSGVDEYQTLLNNPQQPSYLGTSGGLVVAGVHEHLDRGDVNSARIASAGAK